MKKAKTKVVAAPVSVFLKRAFAIWLLTNFVFTMTVCAMSLAMTSFPKGHWYVDMLVGAAIISLCTIPVISGTFWLLDRFTFHSQWKRLIVILAAVLLAAILLVAFGTMIPIEAPGYRPVHATGFAPVIGLLFLPIALVTALSTLVFTFQYPILDLQLKAVISPERNPTYMDRSASIWALTAGSGALVFSISFALVEGMHIASVPGILLFMIFGGAAVSTPVILVLVQGFKYLRYKSLPIMGKRIAMTLIAMATAYLIVLLLEPAIQSEEPNALLTLPYVITAGLITFLGTRKYPEHESQQNLNTKQ
jgi:hypothetical protein